MRSATPHDPQHAMIPELRLLARLCLAATAALALANAAEPVLNPEFRVGSWIWHDHTHARQECRFVRTFEIPDGAAVESARLRIAADNFYNVFLDGQSIGQGADWRVLIEYDLRLLMTPGKHVLAVQAFNDFDVAGLLLGLQVKLADGSVVEVASDDAWKIAPNHEPAWKEWTRASEAWPSAKVINPFWPAARPQVYQAPVSQPVIIPFWQRKWFQISMIVSCLLGAACSIFLLSKLILKSKMETMVRRERARIAADLHDGLGGGMTQLVLLSDASKRAIPQDSAAIDTLDRLCGQTRELLRGMNEAVWLINSQRDNLRDFAAYLGKYAESFFHDTPVRCRFDIEKNLPALPCDIGVRRNLFLAAKEALNNILRHSQATEARLSVRQDRSGIRIIVSDNGKGFQPGSLDGEGNGLENMRQRARDAAGTFEIHCPAAGGCTITFAAPLQSQGRSKSPRNP